MHPVSKTIYRFGFYELPVGLLFLFAPAIGCKLLMLDLPPAIIEWLRVPGAMAVVFGYYYLRCGLVGDMHFARFSIHGRLALLVMFPLMTVIGDLPLQVISFAAADVIGAAWTAHAIRKHGLS